MSFSEKSKEKPVKKITMNKFKDMNNEEIKKEVTENNLYIVLGNDLTLLKVEEFKLQ